MNLKNEEFRWVFRVPYQVGITTATLLGFGCIPVVFHRDAAIWFCEKFVRLDEMPDYNDLDTVCAYLSRWHLVAYRACDDRQQA